MSWLSELLDRLLLLWPFVKVQPWEAAWRTEYWRWPKFRLAWRFIYWSEAQVTARLLSPGLHRRVVFFEEVRKEALTPRVMDLQVQTVTTLDKKQISFSCNITYRVVDIIANKNNVHDFIASLEATSRNHLARRVRELTLDKLLENQTKLEQSLSSTLETRARKWGVVIEDVGFSDLTESTTLRLLSDNVHHVYQDVTTQSAKNED